MKHLVLAIFAGATMFLALNLGFGPGGLRESERLSAHRSRMESNLAELRSINSRLNERVDRLRSDPEAIRIEARKLGYYLSDEAVIRFQGWKPRSEPPSPGREIRPFTSATRQSGLIRSSAISAALLTLIVSLVVERGRNGTTGSRRKPTGTAE